MDKSNLPDPTMYDVEQGDREGHVLMLNGKPALLTVGLRDARKMPNRQYLLMAIEVEQDEDGNAGVIPLIETPVELN